MLRNIDISYRNGTNNEVLDLPNRCPHCGQTMSPHAYRGFSDSNAGASSRFVGVLVKCTADECGLFFSIQYEYMSGSYSLILDSYRPPISVSLPENIEKVSPAFVEIFSQATKAESESLDQIAGVGYRKALEFLIKDYAIRTYPDDEEKIKKLFLGVVISEYLADFKKLQNLAKAATWIGNDETHYIRRHEDKDIRDMKQFIKSASQYIAADFDADMAEEFISETDS